MRIRTVFLRVLPIILLLMMATGCVFRRASINRQRENIDVSFIDVGRTSYREVLEKRGPPDVPIKDLRNFHYTSTDRRMTGFFIRFFLFMPFIWYDEQRIHQVLVELDNDGTVIGVSKSVRDVVRPPFEGGTDRETVQVELVEEGSS